MAIKKRKWYDVEVPLVNETIELIAYEPEEINGRIITLDLTRALRGKSIEVKLKVMMENGETTTRPEKLTLLPYFVRRVMRRGTDYVEDSFLTRSKDAEIRIKPLFVTRKRVSRAVLSALRKKAQEELTEWAKDKTTEELFDDILKNRIQKPLSLKLKKTYPLSLCEIRILEVNEYDSDKEEVQTRRRRRKKTVEKEESEDKEVKEKKSTKKEVKEEKKE